MIVITYEMNSNDRILIVYYSYNDEVCRKSWFSFMNWITSKITRSKYVHVELKFPEGDTYLIKMWGSVIRIPNKIYQEPYDYQEIYASLINRINMRAFLDRCVSNKSSFNYLGFLLIYIWPFSGKNSNKWFCSELVASALERGNIKLRLKPHEITPGKLFELLDERENNIERFINEERDGSVFSI